MQKAKCEALMKRQDSVSSFVLLSVFVREGESMLECLLSTLWLQERRFSEQQAASYERELNNTLEKHKADMKSLELACMRTRQDLERSTFNTRQSPTELRVH